MSTTYFENIKFYEDVNYIGVDGYELSYLTGDSYMFSTSGNHMVDFSFASGNIPDSMFAYCDDIITAYINEDSCEIGAYAFMQCQNLESVYIPSTMAYINSYAFYDTNISYLEILATTPPTLGDNVFSTEPDYISVPTAYENDYKQASGWSDYSDVINPDPVPSYIVRTTFTISDISSPTQIANSDKLGNIYSMVVDGNKMAPTTTYQFTSTGDHSVDYKIYTTQPYILGGQFAHLTYMSYCIVPDGITQIKDRDAFHSTNITGIILPNTLTYLGGGTFVSTKLNHVIIPDSVTGFGDCLFQGAFDLNSVVVGDGVSSITQACFAFCGALNDLSLPSTITSVGRDVFYNNNSLSSVKVRANTNAAFCANTTIMNVLNKKSVNIIIVDANGDEIRDFEIPSTVTSISSQAFKNCTRLNTITSYALTPPTFGNNALQNTQLSAIYVDTNSVDLYKAASGWSNYANIIQAIPQPQPQYEYSVEYTVYGDEEGTTAKYMNPYAFYIEEDGNSEFSIDLFNELVDSITWNGSEMLIENEFDLDYTPSTEGDVVKIIFNSASVPAGAFDSVRMSECTVSEGITTLGATAFQYAGENPLVNHKTSLHLPSTLTSISSSSLDGYFMDIYLDAATPPTTDNVINISSGVYPILHVPSASQTLYENDADWNPLSTGPFAINPNIDLEWSVYNTDDLSAQEYEGSHLMTIYSFTEADTFSQTLYNQIVKRIWINGVSYSPDYNSNTNTLVYWPNANGIHFMRLELQNNASLPEAMFGDWGNNIDYHVNKQITSVTEHLLDGISPGDIYLPSTATTLQANWGAACSAAAIHFETATPPAIDANAPFNLQSKELYVPAASESLYKAAANWSTIARNINPKNSVQVEFEIDFNAMDPDNTGYEYGIKLCNDSKTSLDNYIISGISLTKKMPWQRNIETVLSTNNMFYIAFDHDSNGDIYDPYNIYKIGLASDTAIDADLFKDAFQNYYIDYNQSYDWNDGGQEGNVYVTVNEGITTIGSGAFQDSYANVIYLPSTITSIGDNAFNTTSGNGLSSLYIKAETPPAIGTDILDVTGLVGIHVPAASEAAYKAASGWSNYAQYITGDIYDD